MKLSDRSCKSKEKFADSLMAVANTIHGAVLVSIFVFPLTAFLTAIFGNQESYSFIGIVQRMTWADVGLFAVVYLLPIVIGVKAKEKAMDLYDQVDGLKPGPKKSPANN